MKDDWFYVGGMIRDKLLDRSPMDFDMVCGHGMDKQKLIAAGFVEHQTSSGKSLFITSGGDETLTYMIGDGTIEDDLYHRDLTINAMARKVNTEEIIDPYGGQGDIQRGILRHVSHHFADDPLRVFRVARFASILPDFSIAPETVALCKEIIASPAWSKIPGERVWKEIEKVLRYSNEPRIFFDVMVIIFGEKTYLKEIGDLVGQTQPEKWHPEGDAYEHTMQVLTESCSLTCNTIYRFCALTHDFGKGRTSKDKLPHHYGHELAGVKPIIEMGKRLNIPNMYIKPAKFTAEFHGHIHNFHVMRPATFVSVAQKLRNDTATLYMYALSVVATSDIRGRKVLSENGDPIAFIDKTFTDDQKAVYESFLKLDHIQLFINTLNVIMKARFDTSKLEPGMSASKIKHILDYQQREAAANYLRTVRRKK